MEQWSVGVYAALGKMHLPCRTIPGSHGALSAVFSLRRLDPPSLVSARQAERGGYR